MKYLFSILACLFLNSLPAAGVILTGWRSKPELELLRWCAELNCQTEATLRYFLGDPEEKETVEDDTRSAFWVYQLGGTRSLEVTLEGGRVKGTAYSDGEDDGSMDWKWHFQPDTTQPEKVWRNIDIPARRRPLPKKGVDQ
ncbi:MAG: hypothetical protein EOP88_11175 [Verrucomicrobiaceae bacterium]|nr:MAG: hypothetical protein EOP88_11175 [Verrucomicrobiaceae bacterium]